MEAMAHQLLWLWRSLYESAAMFWEVLWALVLGFAISALLQVFVSKERMTKTLGRLSEGCSPSPDLGLHVRLHEPRL